jgi:hypothetical protein
VERGEDGARSGRILLIVTNIVLQIFVINKYL